MVEIQCYKEEDGGLVKSNQGEWILWEDHLYAMREIESENAYLRKVLIAAGRNAGCLLDDSVSSEFLRHVPDEIAALKASIEELGGKI